MSLSHIKLQEESIDSDTITHSIELRDMPHNKEEKHQAGPFDFKNFEIDVRGRVLALLSILFGNKLNILLFAVPFGFMAKGLGWGASVIFIFGMLAIIPLAFLLGTATEELALRTNQTLGGLLNATFGNATELIISIFALKHNLLRVVQASLLGSVLSNILLVLGCAFFFGGIKFPVQKFNKTAANTASSLLVLAMLSILAPASYIFSKGLAADEENHSVLVLSRITAIFMFVIYISYLIFQLKTHKHLYDEDGADEEEEPQLSWWGAIALLAVTTVLVAIFSEYVVDSITEVSAKWGISQTFIGIVLIPIVGNAAEHVTAVTVAMKDKMELSIGVAIGSSIQISLLVIPVLVLLGWMMNRGLTLYFHPFESVVGFVSVIIVHIRHFKPTADIYFDCL